MVFILAAGSYAPVQELNDAFLTQLGIPTTASTPKNVRRFTTLSPQYLQETKNLEPAQALKNTVESCTEMGVRAALQAIERANLTPDQIGLVVADCSTPIEVTPAESQRIAGRLGLKVPAYDIYTLSGACPGQTSILSMWKKERMPRYTLCVSANAPTQRVKYAAAGHEGWYFSDGASACILSVEDQRGLELISSTLEVDTQAKSNVDLDTLEDIKRHPLNPERLNAQAEKIFSSVRSSLHNLSKTTIYWSLEDSDLQKSILENQQLTGVKVVNNFQQSGDMLGATALYPLALAWSELKAGEQIVVMQAYGSMYYGSSIFRVCEGA